MNAGTPRPYRPPEEDRPIRRTWWTLSLALLALAFITGVRAGTSGDALDWIPFLAVGLAAAAAFLHRRAVARLEARERLETENFARILQGLSRSVSVDAIVGAIVDDLAEGTGADHVVVVRRRPEGRALEATLMTRRDGVPNSTTVLPLTDLESPVDLGPPPAIPVPVSASDRQADQTLVAVGIGGRAEIEDGLSIAGNRGPGLAVGPGALHSPVSSAASRVPSSELARGSHAHRVGSPSRSVSAVLVARRVAHGTSAWLATVLDDLGVAHGLHPDGPAVIPVSEVVGSGASAVTAERIAERVRRVYGLSHTLAAPLQTETGVVGAIVLSRRDRVAWPVAARRLLDGSANE
ncbi:MAG: hypothetical protein HW391_1596, partial [Chloroflexi bacterium]|nr:hypothetical protein [Chloroflexota bacterium]